uniref:Rid family hydrolase n=1 Tax=uncultured Arenimonas sp. TaxID=546226 RepID=UPI0030D90DE1
SYARGGNGAITGLTGMGPEGAIPAGHGAGEQARTALAKLDALLAEQGLSMRDVVRTRLYVTDIGELETYAQAHREAFGGHPPATTVIQVPRLFTPDMRIELDADFSATPARRLDGGSRWEPWFGFSRTVVAGRRVVVSGTTAEGDASHQAEAVLGELQAKLARVGSDWRDVLHLNVIHRDPTDLAIFRQALVDRTGGQLPVLMPLQVASLAGDDMRLDVDAEAWANAGDEQ